MTAPEPPRETPPQRVLLIPGLFYPRWMLLPLRHTLRKSGFDAEAWNVDAVTAPLPPVITRLTSDIERFAAEASSPIGLVTHSFGDWLARMALAELPEGTIDRIASLVPVVTDSPAAKLARPVLGRYLPPIDVISNRQTAEQGTPLPPRIRRLVVWARADLLLRQPPPARDENTIERHVWATHNLLLAHPGVHRMVRSFLHGHLTGK